VDGSPPVSMEGKVGGFWAFAIKRD
jgi:hypothetical protein